MPISNIFLIKSLAILSACSVANAQNSKIFSVSGDIDVAFLINDCQNATETLTYSQNSLINAAIWTTQRINFLEVISPLTLGLSVYQTCSELDFLKKLFDLYQNDQNYILSLVTIKKPSEKVRKFSDVLDIRTKALKRYENFLVKAAVRFLKKLDWRENITVVATDESVMELFYKHSRLAKICIKECNLFEDAGSITLNATGEDPLVFFGTASDINRLIMNDPHAEDKYVADGMFDMMTVFVPLDGDVPTDLPEGSFVILPPHSLPTNHTPNNNVLPTPLLFEMAEPLLNLAIGVRHFLVKSCNETINKVNCLKNKLSEKLDVISVKSPSEILRTLRIDPLEEHFVYDIFKVESSNKSNTRNIFLRPYRKIFTYNIFYDNLTLVEASFEMPFYNDSSEEMASGDICHQGFIMRRNNKVFGTYYVIITFRNESWIYAFVSLSLLGILFCIAILTFLIISIFQRTILEGNPILTLLLLFVVMLIFSSVLPFSIETNKSIAEQLCLIKALAVTLSYAALFSLLLSRSILLSSAAKEVGFMSHVAGPVQSFLSLFIFGVQAALSLQFIGRCKDIFSTYNFIYLMSYNVMLLLLLLCLVPIIYKSQRNYREGKYFTIAIILITLIWCIWLPCFLVLCKDWREFMLCFGLVATGGICLGAIFIPRTYLMTIAAERDKITSALPSLATATSAMDLYRTHQPIYDCVNVAAINAATVARAGVIPSAPAHTLQQPDLYSCPALPEDIDFDLRCDSPASTDKVTRF